jgi:hypothetical protein
MAEDVYIRMMDCTPHVEMPSPNRFGTALFRHNSASLFVRLLVNKSPIDEIAERTMVVLASVKNVAEPVLELLTSHV